MECIACQGPTVEVRPLTSFICQNNNNNAQVWNNFGLMNWMTAHVSFVFVAITHSESLYF